MRKILFLACALMIFASSAFAAVQYSTSSSFTLGEATGETSTVGLSNEVTAAYANADATKPQWYAVGTYHLGGTQVYGTAQDISNIYKTVAAKDPGTGGETGDAATLFTKLPNAIDASDIWSSTDWEAL